MSQYNNQQPNYHFQQHSAGPPQPQWQAGPPKQGWGDPRVSQPSPGAPSPGPQSYPNPYGTQQQPPPSGYAVGPQNPPTNDTSGWGVRYNQNTQYNQHDDTLRPALPPRPPSAASGNNEQWNGQHPYAKPPTPPPRPPEYASSQQPSQSQYFPHDQYSHRPSSHHYEPSPTQWGPQSSHPPPHPPASAPPNWNQAPYQRDSIVSPIGYDSQGIGYDAQGWQVPTGIGQESQQHYTQPPHPSQIASPQQSSIPKPSASALGSGGPSDWERFPGDDHYYQDQHQSPQQQQQHRQSIGTAPPVMVTTPEPLHAIPRPSSSERPQRTSTPGFPQNQPYTQELNQRLAPQHSHSASLSSLSGSGYYDHGRADTNTATGNQDTLKRTGTIDSVIQAWNISGHDPARNQANVEPLKTSSRPSSALRHSVPLRETASVETQTDFPPIVKTETRVETREIDPYEDLKNEYRTSLNRYASMLRQEMAVTNEAEKMKIVAEYVNREIKLRSILFNAEPSELVHSNELAELKRDREDLVRLTKSQEAYKQDLEHSRQDLTSTRQRMDEQKKQLEEMKQELEQAKKEIVDLKAVAAKKQEEDLKPAPAISNRSVIPKPAVDTAVVSHSSSKDDSFVMIGNDGEDVEYSPGGRPKYQTVPKTPVNSRAFSPPQVQTGSIQNQLANQKGPRPPSPASNAPMTLDDYVTPGKPVGIDRSFTPNPVLPPDRPTTGIPTESRQPAPIPFQPARPAYTPFRYGAAMEAAPATVNAKDSVNEAYMKLRHEQAAESGRLLSQEPPSLTVRPAPDRGQSATPSRAQQQHEEAFIGLLRQHSRVQQKPSSPGLTDAPAPLRAGSPAKRKQSIPPLVKTAETLRQCLPSDIKSLTLAKQAHPKIAPINGSVIRIVDDFSFIHATVVSWDKENRKLRQRLDSERATREAEIQAHIDALFNDNEIGYADIAGLEEDSKLEEASKKYVEDQQELESFSRSVFDIVTQRLEKEVAELDTLRIKTLDVLDQSAQSASGRLRMAVSQPQRSPEEAPLVDTMAILLQICQKIEVRYQKIAEAHFERERRRKRLELSVLYTNGDTAGVKKLEKDFDRAQAMQVLSEARRRDDRANKLMDSFDRAVVRGLSENQDWVDDVANKASLLRDLVLGSESNGPSTGQDREELLYGPGGVTSTMVLLQDAAAMVMTDSRDLVLLSTQADRVLNEADFAMFLAEAKIAASDEKEFDKLNHEKAKEDQKLKEEADARMRSVVKGPEEILGCVKDVTDAVGFDKDHKARLNQALEVAKRRNMTMSPSPSPQGPGVGAGIGGGAGAATKSALGNPTPPPKTPAGDRPPAGLRSGQPTMKEV